MFCLACSNFERIITNFLWNAVEYVDRKCNLCNLNDVGDKYHYLLICHYFTTDKKVYIHKKYYSRSNIIKYQEFIAALDKSK